MYSLKILFLVLLGCFFLAHLYPDLATAQARKNTPARQSIRSVQADFVQEKQLPILARPLVSRGRFFFQAPDSLRWEYTSPLHSILLLHQGECRKYIEKEGRMEPTTGIAATGLAVILTELTGWLQGDFHDTAIFQVRRDTPSGLIRLIPRQQGLKNIIQEIDLEPDAGTGLLHTVRIVEDREAVTIMTFTNGRVNQPIAPELFTRP